MLHALCPMLYAIDTTDIGCQARSLLTGWGANHLRDQYYEAAQLRAVGPFQKGEISRSFSIMGGITSRM